MALYSKLQKFLFFLIFYLQSLYIVYKISPPQKPTIYEILPKYNLPSGLFPDSVISSKFFENGTFEVYLEEEISFKQFNYLVRYDKKITGNLSNGSITDLKGIHFKKFKLWFDVDEIRVNFPTDDSYYFTLDVDEFFIVLLRVKKKCDSSRIRPGP
ncbi:hypothetical protein BUALT_Bualt13G0120200 [Buddleja alternifolia]|uniref:Uncharacterized protein n=1 Tax=Buddleja alternifolia TaxID=168488 RepID=A0AAV6WVS1_9LAMI|nr:hypothetical protein BUALT_Bualt13G0120200 [Buddleja alternifolia]